MSAVWIDGGEVGKAEGTLQWSSPGVAMGCFGGVLQRSVTEGCCEKFLLVKWTGLEFPGWRRRPCFDQYFWLHTLRCQPV